MIVFTSSPIQVNLGLDFLFIHAGVGELSSSISEKSRVVEAIKDFTAFVTGELPVNELEEFLPPVTSESGLDLTPVAVREGRILPPYIEQAMIFSLGKGAFGWKRHSSHVFNQFPGLKETPFLLCLHGTDDVLLLTTYNPRDNLLDHLGSATNQLVFEISHFELLMGRTIDYGSLL